MVISPQFPCKGTIYFWYKQIKMQKFLRKKSYVHSFYLDTMKKASH